MRAVLAEGKCLPSAPRPTYLSWIVAAPLRGRTYRRSALTEALRRASGEWRRSRGISVPGADCYQSRPLRASLSAVTDIPQKAFPYTSAALGLASVFS